MRLQFVFVLLIVGFLAQLACDVETEPRDVLSNADVSDASIEDAYVEVGPDIPPPQQDSGGSILVASEYPATELLVRITFPTGSSYATTSGSIVSLSGLVFGRYETLGWETSTGQSGDCWIDEGSPYWQTDGINLTQQDQVVTVTATDEDGKQSSDKILVTYNPAFIYPSRPSVSPPAMFVGRTETLRATIQLGLIGKAAATNLVIQETTSDGVAITNLGKMFDDGALAESTDEIEGDGMFSVAFEFTCIEAGQRYFRVVSAAKDYEGKTYNARSELFRFDCVPYLDATTCASHMKTLADARVAYGETLESTLSWAEARSAAIAVLAGDSSVTVTSLEDEIGGVWAKFDDGVLGAVNFYYPGDRGGAGDTNDEPVPVASVSSAVIEPDRIMSRKMTVLTPFTKEFGALDEGQAIANMAGSSGCPVFSVDGPYNNSGADLDAFRNMYSAGILVLTTHADVYFSSLDAAIKESLAWHHDGSQEVLWTGETVNCGALTTEASICEDSTQCPGGTTCVLTHPPADDETPAWGICYDTTQVDLMAGRVVMGDRTYGVTPAFIDYYTNGQTFPDSLVYMGACRTLYNGSLASELFAAGAKTIAGYSNTVRGEFANYMGEKFFSQMIDDGETTGGSYSIGAEDPERAGTYFRMFGNRSLSIVDSSPLNLGFESGDLSAWIKAGDGRVIPFLGDSEPIDGKFMGIISTGLGFTKNTGTIEQSFCVEPNVDTLTFYWRYYSEEFLEFCGTDFQDGFQVKLIDRYGAETDVISLKVDDLCPVEECSEEEAVVCGSQFVGLEKSDVSFDRGGVYRTEWQKVQFDLSGLVTGDDLVPITLRFHSFDKGDSIFDTAVLLDGITLD